MSYRSDHQSDWSRSRSGRSQSDQQSERSSSLSSPPWHAGGGRRISPARVPRWSTREDRGDSSPRYRQPRDDSSRRRDRNRYAPYVAPAPYVPSGSDLKRYLELKANLRESRSFEEYFFRDNQGLPTVGRDKGRQRLPLPSNSKNAEREVLPQKFIPCSPSLEQRDDSSMSRSVAQNDSSASQSLRHSETWETQDQLRRRPFPNIPEPPCKSTSSPPTLPGHLGTFLNRNENMVRMDCQARFHAGDGVEEELGVGCLDGHADNVMEEAIADSSIGPINDEGLFPLFGVREDSDASHEKDAAMGDPLSDKPVVPPGVGGDENTSYLSHPDDDSSVGSEPMRASRVLGSFENDRLPEKTVPLFNIPSFPDDYLQTNSSKEDKIISDTIKTCQDKPHVDYHDIFRLALSKEQATQNNTRFNIECFSRPVSDEKSSKNYLPLETPGVDKVLSFERGEIGCYLWHRTQNKLHYDKTEQEWTKYKEAAERKNITIIDFPPDGNLRVFQDAGQQFVIMNGADTSGLVERVCLEEVFEDVICGDEKNATEIARPGKRFNRGVSIGIAGCQSSENKKSLVALAQPNIIKGTTRYPNSFGRMTSCALDLIQKAIHNLTENEDLSESERKDKVGMLDGLFKNHDDIYNGHISEWANKCSDGATGNDRNLLQSLSWNCYVHDKPYVDPRIRNVLLDHIDSENPLETSHDVLVGVWQKVYSRRFGRYVTISCTGALRKSCEYLLNRDLLVKKMAYKLLNRANNLPSYLRWIEKDSFCPTGMGHVVVPIHLHTTFHLSAVTGPIMELREWLWRSQKTIMSYYLAEEMCFAFLDTNNACRFHSFVRLFIAEYKRTGSIPLKNDQTFLGECEAYLTRTYGGWNGNKDLSDGREFGAIRYQCTTNVPRSKYTNLMGLRHSERIKKKYKDKPVSRSIFEAAHKEVRESVVGKGDLLASKLLYLDAILGMHLPAEWLDQCTMGSAKTLERLKKEDMMVSKRNIRPQCSMTAFVKLGMRRDRYHARNVRRQGVLL